MHWKDWQRKNPDCTQAEKQKKVQGIKRQLYLPSNENGHQLARKTQDERTRLEVHQFFKVQKCHPERKCQKKRSKSVPHQNKSISADPAFFAQLQNPKPVVWIVSGCFVLPSLLETHPWLHWQLSKSSWISLMERQVISIREETHCQCRFSPTQLQEAIAPQLDLVARILQKIWDIKHSLPAKCPVVSCWNGTSKKGETRMWQTERKWWNTRIGNCAWHSLFLLRKRSRWVESWSWCLHTGWWKIWVEILASAKKNAKGRYLWKLNSFRGICAHYCFCEIAFHQHPTRSKIIPSQIRCLHTKKHIERSRK